MVVRGSRPGHQAARYIEALPNSKKFARDHDDDRSIPSGGEDIPVLAVHAVVAVILTLVLSVGGIVRMTN